MIKLTVIAILCGTLAASLLMNAHLDKRIAIKEKALKVAQQIKVTPTPYKTGRWVGGDYDFSLR